tara:strand:- start:211 stop:1179 length:969 start_codon:yes stop_codon:yes gene_type:complete
MSEMTDSVATAEPTDGASSTDSEPANEMGAGFLEVIEPATDESASQTEPTGNDDNTAEGVAPAEVPSDNALLNDVDTLTPDQMRKRMGEMEAHFTRVNQDNATARRSLDTELATARQQNEQRLERLEQGNQQQVTGNDMTPANLRQAAAQAQTPEQQQHLHDLAEGLDFMDSKIEAGIQSLMGKYQPLLDQLDQRFATQDRQLEVQNAQANKSAEETVQAAEAVHGKRASWNPNATAAALALTRIANPQTGKQYTLVEALNTVTGRPQQVAANGRQQQSAAQKRAQNNSRPSSQTGGPISEAGTSTRDQALAEIESIRSSTS